MTDQVAIQKVNNYFSNDIIRARFEDVLGTREAGAYIASVLLVVANSDDLQKCDPKTIYTSAMRAASLRLSVDPSLGHAHLVPYKGKCTFIPGYKGIYQMAIRTGRYRYIHVGPIYEGEKVVEDRLTGFHHIEGAKTGNEIIGWLGAFEMFPLPGMPNGTAKTFYMSHDEIHEHAAKYAPAYHVKSAPWTTETRKMERKTVLRLMLNGWGYIDPADAAILRAVEDGEDDDAPDVSESPKVTNLEERSKSEDRETEIMNDLGYDTPKTDQPNSTPPPMPEEPPDDPIEGEFVTEFEDAEKSPQKSKKAEKSAPVADIAQLFVENGISDTRDGANGLIENYLPDDLKSDPEKAVKWGKLFRGWKDARNVSTKDAAERATNGETP